MIFKPFTLLKDDPPILKVIRSNVEVNYQKIFIKQLQLKFWAMILAPKKAELTKLINSLIQFNSTVLCCR